jgi:UDP-sugar pyrophosphorylase
MTVEETPRQMLRGIPFTTGPRVILRPSFALTLADVRQKIRNGRISGDATLILDGDARLENVTIPDGTSLIVHAKDSSPVTLRDFTATQATRFAIQPLTDEEMQSPDVEEYLRIRGYRIVKSETTP